MTGRINLNIVTGIKIYFPAESQGEAPAESQDQAPAESQDEAHAESRNEAQERIRSRRIVVEVDPARNEVITLQRNGETGQRDRGTSELQEIKCERDNLLEQVAHYHRERTVFNDKIAELEAKNQKLSSDLADANEELKAAKKNLEEEAAKNTAAEGISSVLYLTSFGIHLKTNN